MLEETGRFAEALKIYESIINEKDPDATLSPGLDAREKLAILYQSVGEFAKAETLVDSLLQYRRQWQPRKISQLHSTRGRFYLQVGALDKANQEFEAALTYLDPNSKDSSIDVATVHGLQALVLLERGQPAAALAKYKDVLQSRIDSFGPKHMRCAEVYDQIAKVQRTLGRYSDATEAHRKAIDIHEYAYGPGHHAVAWAQHRVGTTHFVFHSPDVNGGPCRPGGPCRGSVVWSREAITSLLCVHVDLRSYMEEGDAPMCAASCSPGIGRSKIAGKPQISGVRSLRKRFTPKAVGAPFGKATCKPSRQPGRAGTGSIANLPFV